MRLKDLIRKLDIISLEGNEEIEIKDIKYDSKQINIGDLFICLKGSNVNGHMFIDEAKRKGAVCFLIEDNVEYDDNYTYIKVKNTYESMSILSDNFYNHPCENIKLIGVTGTNGKTSIATFLKEILNNKSKCGFIGTTGIYDGSKMLDNKNTTPNNLEIQKNLYNMVKNKCEYCTMEVSSHALALNRVDNIEYDIGIFTNLTQDHLDFHKTFEEYRNAKERLFYKTTKMNIINIDDINGRIILENIKKLNIPICTYGMNCEATFRANDVELYEDKTIYTLIGPNNIKEKVILNMVGEFTVYNSLSVICTLYTLNMPIKEIIHSLEELKPVRGRFERVENNKKLNVFVDYAHTPDALDNVLKSMKTFAKGRIITVFGCGGNREKEKRPIMGQIAQNYSDIAIITSDNPRFEEPQDIIKDIMRGINIYNKNYMVIEDRKEAIKKAIDIADNKDIVLIAGKGHETYQIVKDKTIEFDDKKVAKEMIDKKI